MELTNRKKRILRAIVEIYIATAEPVGSKAVAEQAGLDISSATIRNEMADLTEMGYLEQPHTSAGRIPSPKGYRLYVNELMEEHRLTMQEAEKINEALNLKIREMDQVMSEAGKIISQLTKYPTFALTKGNSKVVIRRYDLLMVEENSFIAVLMTDGQQVKNKLFHLQKPLSDTQLQLLGTLLNTSFTGLTLEELGPELDAAVVQLFLHHLNVFFGQFIVHGGIPLVLCCSTIIPQSAGGMVECAIFFGCPARGEKKGIKITV